AYQSIGGTAERVCVRVEAGETNLVHVPPGLCGVDTARPGLEQRPARHRPVRKHRLDMARDPFREEGLTQATRPVGHGGLDRLSRDELPDGGGGEDTRTRFKPFGAALLELVKDG